MHLREQLRLANELLILIHRKLNEMSITAAQAEADLSAAVTNLTTVTTAAVSLLNQLVADLKAGTPLSVAAVEASVASINAQVASLQAAVTADTPAPAAPAA